MDGLKKIKIMNLIGLYMQNPVIRLSYELACTLHQVILIFSKQFNRIVTVFEIFNIPTVM